MPSQNNNKALFGLFILIIVISVGFAVYLLRQSKTSNLGIDTLPAEIVDQPEQVDEVPPTQEPTNTPAPTVTPTTTATPQPENTTVTTDADIDKDLKSLDSLDLSDPENEYSEDSLSDL